MRLSVRFTTCFAFLSALAMGAGCRVVAQSTAPATSTNGTYIAIDPLAKVTYDNKYDISLGMAYDHTKAGPTLLHGAELGGLDLAGSYWLKKRWAVEATARGYVGTSGAGTSNGPNGGNAQSNIKGPMISEYFFAAGPEWLGPHNKHGAILGHVLAGGTYGNYEQDLQGQTPSTVAFYQNQMAPAIIAGGHIDLNRSDRWVFRITPDAVMKHMSTNYSPNIDKWDVHFALSVGLEYKFKKKR